MKVNIVVVDDEERIRQGLAKLVTLAGEEYQVTGIFSSAHELMLNIDTLAVDLIITDIMMPNVNGLQLIEKMQKHNPKLKFAIVSGFDDFTFARQALRYGVEEYLLKPVDSGELEQLLRKVREKLEKDQQLDNVAQDDQLKLILFNNSEMLPKHLRSETCRELDRMPLFQQSFMVFVIRGAEQLTIEQMNSIVSGWLTNWSMVEWDESMVMIVGLNSNEHADRVREVGQTLLHRLPPSYSGALGGSDVFRGTTWLREAYKQADLAMQYAWYEPSKRSFADYGRISLKPNRISSLNVTLEKELQNELAASNYKNATELIGRWLLDVTSIKPTWSELREGCDSVLTIISRYLPEGAVMQLPVKERLTLCDAQRSANIQTFIAAYQREVEQQLQFLQEARQENRVVEIVKQYILNHYSEELELNRLAEEVYLTPSYLSKLFKTETGVTITDFLISVRIDRAKDLLREELVLKTYEVGERVGYADPAYFNKVFKKIVGSTPKEYRDRVR